VIQREDKVKKGYIEKLNAVLTSLAASSPIPPLAAVDDKERKRSLYYHYAGTFRIKEPVPDNPSSSTVATIAAKMDSRDILLDASLRNFSDGPMPDGSFNLHSGNYRFFKGDVSLYMTCVLVALEVSPKRVIGSPLFLQLTIADDDEKVVL